MDLGQILNKLEVKFPHADPAKLARIAETWAIHRERSIKRMLALFREQAGSLPSEIREELVFELAKLTLALEDQIVEKNTENRAIETIDPDEEAQALNSPLIRERIENTAQILCEHAWKPIVAEWTKKYRRVASDSSFTTKRSKLVSLSDSSGGVRNQHYSPVFANEFWASNEAGRKVRVYSRGLDLEIVSKDKGYSRWACEKFLYSQKLEKHFHLMEGDARRPYQRLLDTIPLTEMDRRHWIAYLIAQIYRTPRGVRWQVNGLKRIITERRWSYPTNVGSLRAAYETLFTASPVFAFYYRLFDRLEWHMLRATAGTHFLRSDEPVVMGGSIDGATWQLLYPMTPLRCFVLGPRDAEERKRIVPSGRELTANEVDALNARIARSARESVIGQTVGDDAATRALLRANLGLVQYERFNLEDSLLEFWG